MNKLPDPTDAVNMLTEHVYSRVFFNKAAACGRSCSTPEEARQLLELGQEGRKLAHQQAATKSAQDGSLYGQVLSAVRGRLADDPMASDARYKQAGAALAQSDEYYDAVLAIEAANAASAAA